MHLAVGGEQLACGSEDEGRVVVALRRGDVLGDAAADQVGGGFFGEGGEGVVGGGLRGGGGGREEGFRVFGEVLAAVRRVEAFGEHDDGGAGLRGGEDLRAGVGEVVGLVGAWVGEGGC